ncbi:hypothetical protein V1283_003349 [Bradyrhizobium sp. AZCC 2262]|uniref:DUF4150 domain-containing protein n=1 Tax=Bradyrhizobium sp. AZCC 2262 TaxID=3117022 RepID=UPI002FF4090A
MGKPITTTAQGICFAFPNVCYTPPVSIPLPLGVPIPYPSIGKLADTQSAATSVKAGGSPVVLKRSKIQTTTSDSAGSLGGVISHTFGKEVEFVSASGSVFANGSAVVRMFDKTKQNHGNANGIVLGGFPRVMVGD